MNDNISNLSYTNKDFTSIFTELLDLVKKLSNKWDPSISNESDPGVVLLKIGALLTDKLNYNIDKNILETFPVSVTQERNAWNLFEQLGYYMHWYISGTTTIGIKWSNPSTDGTEHIINLPRFTLVCDDETSVFYTLTEPVSISTANTNAIAVQAIQGKPYTYSINGVSLITANNLDGTKLYFADSNVAENGVFITNDGFNNYDEWKRVDNLAVQDKGTRCYKFGVDISTNQCYIQFPDDIYDIIGDGINITYIISSGLEGNIKANTISKFYESSVDATDGTSIDLSEDVILVTNPSSVTNGADIEDIDTAYRNYQKTIGVFKTLVSLSDYKNYLDASDVISACVVADRTTDIQTTYKVKHKTPEGYITDIQHFDTGVALKPFDLKIIALKYQNTINSKQEFDVTFDLVDYTDTTRQPYIPSGNPYIPTTNVPYYINSYLTDIKSIQHDIYGVDKYNLAPALIRNKYPINVKIIPQYTLTDLQVTEVKNNIVKALYNNLNAKILNFGTEVTYDMVYNIIQNSDNRIKAIVLDNLVFNPYIEVWDTATSEFVEIALNPTDNPRIIASSILAGHTPWRKTPTTNYGIYQNGRSFNEQFCRIGTQLTYTVGANTTGKHTLGKNENIQIAQPNYQATDEFSTGVRYEALLSHPIDADTNYVLQSGEYLFFYWQYNSNSESPIYQFKAYGEGNVVNPTFALTSSTATNVGVSIYGGGVNSSTDKIYSGIIGSNVSFTSGGETYNFNKFINGEYNSILGSLNKLQSGTRTITRKQVNHLHIDSTSNLKCYWITNIVADTDNTGKLSYVLPMFKYGYLLKTNEYFIVTTTDNSNMVIYGAGTKIEYKENGSVPNTSYLTVPYLDSTNVLNNGVSSITDWFTLLNGNTIDITEMAVTNLGEETNLVITNHNESDNIVLCNLALYKVTVDSVNGLTIDGTNEDDTSYTFTDTDSTIQYNDTYLQDGEYYIQPTFNVSMSPENPMILTNFSGATETMSDIQIILTLWDDMVLFNGTPTTIEIDSSDTQPIYVLPSYAVDTTGDVFAVDVRNINSTGDTELLSVYEYSYAISLSSNITAYTSGDITMSTNSSATISDVQLPNGTYLVPIINPNTDVTVSVTVDGTAIDDIYGNDITSKGYGIWYAIIKYSGSGVDFSFSFGSGSADKYIYVLPATKIENTELFDIIDSNGDIVSPLSNPIVGGLLANLDFAWDYEIPASELVENPLLATSLHDKNNIMHDVTIDMLDLSENSSIEIINR